MNKLITKIIGACLGMSMAAGVGIGVAVGAGRDVVPVEAAYSGSSPYSITLVSGTGGASGTVRWQQTSTSLTNGDGVTWTPSVTWAGTASWTNSNSHTQIGANGKAASLVTLTTSDISGTINSVAVACASYQGKHTVGVSVGGVAYTMDNSATPTWSSSVDTSRTGTGSSSGTIVVTFDGSASGVRALYVKSITVTFTGSSPTISSDATASVKKGQTTTVSVSYANVASGVAVSATSDDTSVATVTSSQTTTGASGSLSYTVTGVAEGTANISFSGTYSGKSLSASCAVTVYEEKSLEKISKLSELNTSREDGGRYVIASSTDNTIVMSTTQNQNNRGKTTATITDGVMAVPGASSIALVNILKVGDYYTIYDSVNEGYLYAVSGNNYLRTSNPETKTDYYYWSISFSGTNAVITNKGNSYVIRYNSSNSLFSTYGGTQNAVELYEVDSDIPAYVKLTSLTASDDSVHAGSVLTYTAEYLPINATEGITVSGDNDSIATVNSYGMDSGTLTVKITGVSAGSITLSMVGDDENTNVNESVTITVTSYVATHDLVTSKSSLSNGSKVVIACTAADNNFIAEKSTGGNNLNAIAAGFSSDKTTLAATADQEFTVWCVDTTNHYYVFSDGGYFLASPTAKNNYLLRTNVLSETCYFTIEDDASGVIIKNAYGVNHEWKDVTAEYSIEFNSSTSKFSLYGSAQKATSLYLSKQSLNHIQGFVDAWLHFGNVPHNPLDDDTGACKDSGYGYFTAALTAYGDLSASEKETFCTSSTYADAYDRLSDWASANGYEFVDYSLVEQSRININIFNKASDTTAIIIVVVSVLSLASLGAFFLLRKKKEVK